MRKTWGAIATIALLVAFAAVLRTDRSANPQREFARADRVSESLLRASQRTTPIVPETPSSSPTQLSDDRKPIEIPQSTARPPRGTPPSAAPMIATITVPQYAAKGAWSVSWAQVTDKAHNSQPYYRNDPALAGALFTVE